MQMSGYTLIFAGLFLKTPVSSFPESLRVGFSECDSEIVCTCCAVNPLCLSGFPLISERELTLAQVSCAGPWD